MRFWIHCQLSLGVARPLLFAPRSFFLSVLKMLGTLLRRQFDIDKIRESEDHLDQEYLPPLPVRDFPPP